MGARFEELAYILSEVKESERLGICFDTSHVFSAGYDIRGYEGYKNVLEEFDRLIGIRRIEAFHLNDSVTEFGARHDRHAWIGEGKIGLQAFHALVRDKRFKAIPMLLEMHVDDSKTKENLELLREMEKRPQRISGLTLLR